VLGQNNFSNQKQIDLLKIINFVLYKKHYPQDICGIVERKIKLLEQSEQEAAPIGSNLQLSTKKGFKVNFIRVVRRYFRSQSGLCPAKQNHNAMKKIVTFFAVALLFCACG